MWVCLLSNDVSDSGINLSFFPRKSKEVIKMEVDKFNEEIDRLSKVMIDFVVELYRSENLGSEDQKSYV